MYRKCLIMEIKDKYAIAMDDSGEILRIKIKNGMKTGDEIYVLSEDLYNEKLQKPLVVPFTVKHKEAIKHMGLMVATLLVCFIVAVTTSNMGDACAKVMLDGNKSIEFILNDEFEVLEASSKDGSFSEKQLKDFKGKELSEIKDIINRLMKNNGSNFITGFKLLDDHMTKDELENYLSELFGKHIIDVDDDLDDITDKIEEYLDDLDDSEKDRMKDIYKEHKEYIEEQSEHIEEQEERKEQEKERQEELKEQEKERQEELKEQEKERQKEEKKRQEEIKKEEEKRQEELKEQEEKRQEELKEQEEKKQEEIKEQEEKRDKEEKKKQEEREQED